MVLSAKHERPSHVLALLVEVLAEEMGVDVDGLGSTTFRRKDLSRGFEPDACFYIQNADRIKGKDEIDLTVDPPPDLVIEVDITNPSLNKFPLFATLGIPEVWRFDGAHVQIFKLEEGQYVTAEESQALAGVTADVLSQFVATNKQLRRTVWLRRVRQWVREARSTEK